jgi:MFS family permease
MFGTAALLSLLLPNLKPADAMRKHLKVILADTGIELKRNWQAITSQPKLYAPIMYLTLVQAVLGTILTLAPALALALLAAPLTDVSQFLIIPAGLGMVTGVVLIGFFNRWWSKEKLVRGSSLIMAISFLVLGLVGRFHIFSSLAGNQELVAVRWFVAALVLTLGLVNAVLSTSAQTILQENTSEDTRGKVFGALNMLLNIASTLPVLLAATLADRFGVTTVLIVLGGFLTVAVLALAAFSLRQTKALTRSSN